MLWYKAWLEIRWRMAMITLVVMFILFQLHSKDKLQLHGAAMLGSLEFMWVVNPVTLAGAGIRPESPFRAIKGIQSSLYFTLSLPISRFRLLAARALYGLLAVGAVVAVCIALAALVFPEVRTDVTVADGIRYAFTVILCSLAAFGVSTLIATFLDQQWQAFMAMIAAFGLRWIFGSITQTRFDFFKAMGSGSPLVNHAMPWPAIGVSFAIGLAAFIAAAKVEQSRQY